MINMKNKYSCKHSHLPWKNKWWLSFWFLHSYWILHIDNIIFKELHRNLLSSQKKERERFMLEYFNHFQPKYKTRFFQSIWLERKQFNPCLKWAILILLGCQKILYLKFLFMFILPCSSTSNIFTVMVWGKNQQKISFL